MKLARVEEMRALDRRAVEEFKIPEVLLMENAGLAALAVLEREGGIKGRRFLLLCGQGNNGGDGFVCARQIISRQGEAKVFILGEDKRIRGAAGENLATLRSITSQIETLSSLERLKFDADRADLIIDAIYGTGLNREVDGLAKEVIEFLNRLSKPVLSLDIPSGINGDTGEVMGTAVRASFTVTFGLPKTGNILYPGFDFGGKLYHSYISFPPLLYDSGELPLAINEPMPLPVRESTAHKGQVGDCLFIAGARGYFGAPYLSAMSFLKAGGGYARLAAPSSIIGTVASLGPEIVFLPQGETEEGSIAFNNLNRLIEVAERVDLVVIGPGLSLNTETKELVRSLVGMIKKPLIIDGDGLTAVAEDPACLRNRKAPTCLTPHPGEMARLKSLPSGDVNRKRLEVARDVARDFGCTVVLKGAHSVIAVPDGRAFVNLTGNAGMATAGSGDVLAGTIAAMYGQGLPWEEAVKKGVFIHGRAGDLVRRDLGEEGITASSIMTYLPQAIREDRAYGTLPIISEKLISL